MAAFLSEWERASGHPLDPVTRSAFAANDATALAAYMRAAEREPRVPDAQLAALRMPVLLLAGTRDPERLRSAHYVHGLVPGAELVVLTAPHMPTHPGTRRPSRPSADSWRADTCREEGNWPLSTTQGEVEAAPATSADHAALRLSRPGSGRTRAG